MFTHHQFPDLDQAPTVACHVASGQYSSVILTLTPSHHSDLEMIRYCRRVSHQKTPIVSYVMSERPCICRQLLSVAFSTLSFREALLDCREPTARICRCPNIERTGNATVA
jgi:hypothetical protein